MANHKFAFDKVFGPAAPQVCANCADPVGNDVYVCISRLCPAMHLLPTVCECWPALLKTHDLAQE